MKGKLHQRNPLNSLTFHLLDTVDIKEMIFVIGGHKPLDLVGCQSAIGLCHINGGSSQSGENVHCHVPNGQNRKENDGQKGYNNGNGFA